MTCRCWVIAEPLVSLGRSNKLALMQGSTLFCWTINLCCDVHDVAYTSGLGEGNAVHAAGEQMAPSPHPACCYVGTLLHPSHHLLTKSTLLRHCCSAEECCEAQRFSGACAVAPN